MEAGRNVVPGRHIRLRRIGDAEGGQHFAVEAFIVIGQRHVVDRGDVEALDNGAFAHIAEQRELLLFALGIGRSQRTSRTSGAMPMERSSFTECWVGLVLSSPAEGM